MKNIQFLTMEGTDIILMIATVILEVLIVGEMTTAGVVVEL